MRMNKKRELEDWKPLKWYRLCQFFWIFLILAQRQAEVLAKFAAQQKAFKDTIMDEEEDIEDESYVEELPICCLCKDTTKNFQVICSSFFKFIRVFSSNLCFRN